jgi:hypothetical protein
MKLKRSLVALAAACVLGAASLAASPAFAVGPLAAILIGYAKQALKERLLAYAKEQVGGRLAASMGDAPGALSAFVPGILGGAAPRPALPGETRAMLESSGLLDRHAAPLTDADWKELEDTVTLMAREAGAPPDEVPDIAELRASVAQAPELTGMVRRMLDQFRAVRAEQARMRELYEQMPEPQRQEVVAELVRTVREAPPELQPQARRMLQGESLGLAPDLKRRLAAALG